MPKRAPANPDKFEEASTWFRARTPVTRDEWELMSLQARRQAFTIAGTQQLKVVQTVFDSIGKAIDKGTPIEQWRKEVMKQLGGEFTSRNAHTLTTAFINANQTAYNTGRYYQLNDPSVTTSQPYQVYDAVMDSRTSPTCSACNGVLRRHDDPWWLTHWPPMHHRCRSTVRALTATQAKRKGGITKTLPRPAIGDEWGLAPPLRAGQVWEPERSKYDPTAFREYQRKQARMKAANDNANAPSKRLGDVGQKVFGRKLTDAEIDDLVGLRAQLPTGYSLSVSVKENQKAASVRMSAAIIDEKGKPVGSFIRDYTAASGGKTDVNHSAFYLNADAQGKGLGRSIFNAQVDAYEKHKIGRVTLDASEVGKYVWTKAGFEWTEKPQAKRLVKDFKAHLKSELGATAAKKIAPLMRTPEDVARAVVGKRHIGKQFLVDRPGDVISMSQEPGKIKRL